MAADRHTVFVLMPFDDEFSWLYKALVKAGSRVGVAVERADDIAKAGGVLDQVLEQISEVDGVIAVTSRLNPNVFLELGFALRYLQPILVAATIADLPFDIGHLRAILYDGLEEDELVDRVGRALVETLETRRPKADESTPDLGRFFARWLPRSTYPPLSSDRDALLVRACVAVPLPNDHRSPRVDDKVRSAMVNALRSSKLALWLGGQLAVSHLPRRTDWRPEGPNNTSRGATLVWRAEDETGEHGLVGQCVLVLPTEASPSDSAVILLDAALRAPAEALDVPVAADPTVQAHAHLPLYRFYALLDAATVTALQQIPETLPLLLGENQPVIGPVFQIDSLGIPLDRYIDFGSGKRTPGTTVGHGATLRPDPQLNLHDNEGRQLQIKEWIETMLLDAGVLDVHLMMLGL